MTYHPINNEEERSVFWEMTADADDIFLSMGTRGLELLEFTDTQILVYLMGRREDITYVCLKNNWDIEKFKRAISGLNLKKRKKQENIDKFMTFSQNGGRWVGATNAYSNEHFAFLWEDDGENVIQARLEDTRGQIKSCLSLP